MTLAVRKARIIWKEDGQLRGLNLVRVLIQDQILYFTVCVHLLLDHAVILIIY